MKRIRLFLICFFLMTVELTGCRSREEAFFQDEAASEQEMKSQWEEESEISGMEMTHSDSTQEMMDTGQREEISQTPQRIYVDVCGAVRNPGVYELVEDSRVFQAIEKAGGYTEQAAVDYLNKARLLNDGQQIYIPTSEELLAEENQEFSYIENKAPEAMKPESSEGLDETGASEQKVSESETGLIDLNTADESELTTLAGIGASKARAIIAYREENGGFASIEELMNVEGIKEGTFSKIKDKIAVK